MGGECDAGEMSPTVDTIAFAAAFNGELADTITTTGLPPVTEELIIDGGNCNTAAQPKPCVGVHVSPAANALTASAELPSRASRSPAPSPGLSPPRPTASR
jgi:hypothetical protein